MNDKYINFFNLIVNFDPLAGDKIFYGQLELFLKNNLKAGELYIFSRPIQIDDQLILKDPLKYCRTLWNKKSFQDSFKKSESVEIMKNVESCESLRKKWFIKKIKDKSYLYFYCGESKKQTYFGICQLNEDGEEALLDKMVQFLGSASRTFVQLKGYKRLEDLIHIDDVTGLYNQRKLYKDLEGAVKRFSETSEGFALLFIDIDHFKNVNDGHGHMVGTQLLADMAVLLKKTLRESDLIYRYGGDEFVMLIPAVSSDTAILIGERVLKSVKEKIFSIKENDIFDNSEDFRLSVSVGVATYPEDAKSTEEILKIADKMMYEAKKQGRARVCYTRDLFNKAQ